MKTSARKFRIIAAILASNVGKPKLPAIKLYNVFRRKDSEVVATGVTFEAATELVEKAKRQKRAALELVAA